MRRRRFPVCRQVRVSFVGFRFPPEVVTTDRSRASARVIVELELLLDTLPDGQRDELGLTQLMGYRDDETTDISGCPVGTIRSRVARACATLVTHVSRKSRGAGRLTTHRRRRSTR